MRNALFATFLIALPIAAPAGEGGKPGPFTRTLKAGEVAEDCVRMKPGEVREFDWTADGPVDFNVHWHEGDRVEYPVQIDSTWKGRGRFVAEREQDYCWMWTAPKKSGAVVMGNFKPVK